MLVVARGPTALWAVQSWGFGMIAAGQQLAIGGPVPVSGNVLIILSGYVGMLIILVVFGIWGFRLGSRGSNGNPGGGPKRPERPEPVTPPRGGRELAGQRGSSDLDLSDADPAARQEQAPEPARDLVAPGSRG